MYCFSSFLVFLKHTFSLEQEPAKKKPGAGQKWTGSATLLLTVQPADQQRRCCRDIDIVTQFFNYPFSGSDQVLYIASYAHLGNVGDIEQQYQAARTEFPSL